jgi:hypothetical protein
MGNTFVNFNAGDLNDVLRTNGHIVVNEDDDIDKQQFNKEDYCGHDNDNDDDDEEKEEEDNVD